MGIENRDYIRESSDYSGGGSLLGAIPPACKYLIIANIVVFLLQIFITRPVGLEEIQKTLRDNGVTAEQMPMLASQWPRESVVEVWFRLETRKVLFQGQVWRLVTSAFCHDRFGIWHIAINMLLFFWFGRTLEVMYGTREFLLFYFAAAITASCVYIFLDLILKDFVPMIGASGAVMAVLMLFAVHFPRHTVYIYLIPIEIRWLVVLYVIFDLHPVLLALAGNARHTGVAHAAHLGGLAFGYLYWKSNLRLERYWDRLPWRRSQDPWTPRRSRSMVSSAPATIPFRSRPDSAQQVFDARVDDVLGKLHREGKDSLTDEDRQLLEQASEKYRRDK